MHLEKNVYLVILSLITCIVITGFLHFSNQRTPLNADCKPKFTISRNSNVRTVYIGRQEWTNYCPRHPGQAGVLPFPLL